MGQFYICMRPCENKTMTGYCKTTVCINPRYSNYSISNRTTRVTLSEVKSNDATRIR